MTLSEQDLAPAQRPLSPEEKIIQAAITEAEKHDTMLDLAIYIQGWTNKQRAARLAKYVLPEK